MRLTCFVPAATRRKTVVVFLVPFHTLQNANVVNHSFEITFRDIPGRAHSLLWQVLEDFPNLLGFMRLKHVRFALKLSKITASKEQQDTQGPAALGLSARLVSFCFLLLAGF